MSLSFTALRTVLSIEDNPGDAFMIAQMFRETKQPIDVVNVPDGVEAMAYLRQEGRHVSSRRPDLILLDLNLPKMDGREVLAEVKAHPQWQRIPVLIFSTSESSEDVRRCYDLHANCYFTKPSDLSQFNATVQAIAQTWLSLARLPETSN